MHMFRKVYPNMKVTNTYSKDISLASTTNLRHKAAYTCIASIYSLQLSSLLNSET
jgi:hypothetical protein